MANDKINETFDDIIAFQEKDVAQITERVFKATILPMIANEDPNSADFSGWLTLAGNWRRPIDVTDDQSDEILFRVPALVGDTELPPEQVGHNSAFEIIQNARRKMQTVPRAGDEHLVRGLNTRVRVKGELSDNQKRWNVIYSRYGLSFQAGDGETSTEESPDKPTSTVVGYDDL